MHTRRPRRALLRAATAILAAAIASIASAQPLAVRIYPIDTRNVSDEYAADARGLLQIAVARLARGSELLYPADPLILRRSCGVPPVAECLARLATGGVVVTGSLRASAAALELTLEAIDAAGRVYGPVVATVDSFLQSSEPIFEALHALERRIESAAHTASAPGAAAAPHAPETEATEDRAAPVPGPSVAPPSLSPSPSSASRADETRRPVRLGDVQRESRPLAGGWRGLVGKTLFFTGLASLTGGVAVAVVDQRLSQSLENRFDAGTLTGSDTASYRRVQAYNTVANALFITGGVLAATGATLWAIAPDVGAVRGGARLGITGRF